MSITASILLTACPNRGVLTCVQAGVIKDLVLLACVGVRPVLVHGGGPEINVWLNKLGIKAEFKNGLRVTDGKLSHYLQSFCCMLL